MNVTMTSLTAVTLALALVGVGPAYLATKYWLESKYRQRSFEASLRTGGLVLEYRAVPDPVAVARYRLELRDHRRQDRARALLRTSRAFTPVTPVDRSHDGFWRQSWIALCRTSPAFSPVAPTPSRPTPPTPREPAAWPPDLNLRLEEFLDVQRQNRQEWGRPPGPPSARPEGSGQASQDDPED